jgi:hypothetical protein
MPCEQPYEEVDTAVGIEVNVLRPALAILASGASTQCAVGPVDAKPNESITLKHELKNTLIVSIIRQEFAPEIGTAIARPSP